MYSVYIIFSQSGNRYYIGQTSNVDMRLSRHNAGYEKSTKPYIPWEMIFWIEKNSRSEAMVLEKKLKNLNTKDLLKFIDKFQTRTGVVRSVKI